ncbi:hypothetical protein QCA50_014273 [Cerrena zonata]|uniref:Enoyl reductase (ER) domain-containing protein n=1 Tax=Cerrena zonata TaxID=2478898 RepID=A0AAW0FY05_9APHY
MRQLLIPVLLAFGVYLFLNRSRNITEMSIPTQQKALVVPEAHAPFQLATIDVPKPEAGEVLVRIEATALNPVDWKIQAYNFFIQKYPAVLGTDIAGTVVQLGSGVTNLAVGDKVVFQGYFTNRLASYQEYTIGKAETIAKIPSGFTFDQAATIPVGAGAAFVGLYGPKSSSGGAALTPFWAEGGRGKYAGKPIVVFGGSSSVGQYVLQLAKLSGFSHIITTASAKNAAHVKSLGATHVVDRSLSPSEIVAEVKKITSEPVLTVFDAIALADTQTTGYEILASGGTLVLTLAPTIPEDKRVADKTIIDTLGSVHVPANHEVSIGFYSNLPQLLLSGELKPNSPEVLPGGLAGIAGGLDRLKNGQVSATKLVVHPPETA